MSNYQVIESLRITIETLQLDPRRDDSHPLHDTWTSLVKMFQEQLDEAIDSMVPDVIRTIPQRIEFSNNVRTIIINMVNKLTEDDITHEDLLMTYNNTVTQLNILLLESTHLTGLTMEDVSEIDKYLSYQLKELSDEDSTDRLLKIIGKVTREITNLLGIDIDSVEDKEESEDESSIDSSSDSEQPFTKDVK